MIKLREELNCTTEINQKGDIKLYISDLADFNIRNDKLRTFALAQLKAQEEVEFHVHEGEAEYYYILSGIGVYTDNQNKIKVTPGMVTFTPSGSGHGIKNTGSETLEFIALIIKD